MQRVGCAGRKKIKVFEMAFNRQSVCCDYMTVRFKPLKCTIDVSVHGAFGVWSWAALTSRFIARGVRHRDEHL